MRFSTLPVRLQRLTAASATALGSGAVAHLSGAAESPHEDAMAQLRKQADKARQRAQERVRLGESEMLGMTPKLWLEALDEEHRHGSSLHQYWQRWEASRTRWSSLVERAVLGTPQLAILPPVRLCRSEPVEG